MSKGTVSVKKNFLYNFSLQFITYVFPIILAPYLARVLTPVGVGNNAVVLSIVTFFVLSISFGYIGYGTRTISALRDNRKEYSSCFWDIVFSKCFLFFVVFLIYSIVFLFLNVMGQYRKLFLAYSILLLDGALNISFFFQGLEKFKIISLLNIFSRSLCLILTFVLVKNEGDLLKYVIIYCSQTFFVSFASWFFVKDSVNRPDFHNVHPFIAIKNSLLFFLPTIAMNLCSLVDKTMLGFLASNLEVGYYEEATKAPTIIIGLICSLAPVMLSRMSKIVDDKTEFSHKIYQMFEVYFLLAFPAFFGLMAITSYFVVSFFGSDYYPSVDIGLYFAPVILFSPISILLGSSYYGPKNKILLWACFYFVGAFVNIVLNVPFIRFLGGKGAAMTSVLSELIMAFLFVFFSKKDIFYKPIFSASIKPFACSAIMFGVLEILNFYFIDGSSFSYLWRLIFDITVGSLVYFLLLVVSKEPFVFSSIKRYLGK